jgi:hypothetical protein
MLYRKIYEKYLKKPIVNLILKKELKMYMGEYCVKRKLYKGSLNQEIGYWKHVKIDWVTCFFVLFKSHQALTFSVLCLSFFSIFFSLTYFNCIWQNSKRHLHGNGTLYIFFLYIYQNTFSHSKDIIDIL